MHNLPNTQEAVKRQLRVSYIKMPMQQRVSALRLLNNQLASFSLSKARSPSAPLGQSVVGYIEMRARLGRALLKHELEDLLGWAA